MKNESSLKILAIGFHPEIMSVLDRLINSHSGWTGTIVSSIYDAKRKLREDAFDALLLCVGVSELDEQILQETIHELKADTKIIRHYGGGSGLLENEIRAALFS